MEQEYTFDKAAVIKNLMDRTLGEVEEIKEKAEYHMESASDVYGALLMTRFSDQLKARVTRAEMVAADVVSACDDVLDIRFPRTRLSRQILSGVVTLFRKGGSNG